MAQATQIDRISIDVLLDLKGADRAAKAYAFLYAAFRRTEVSSSPVRDALDCLIPFITPYLNKIPSKQVDVSAVQYFLKSTFGFDIPLYALEQLLPALQKVGLVDFNKGLRIFTAKTTANTYDVVKSEIELDFDRIESQLGQFAHSLGFTVRPPAGTWGDALILFLKTQPEKPSANLTQIKGTLLDPNQVQDTIVAGYIKRLHDSNYAEFEKLLRIFMGVLIEEFISSVTEIGALSSSVQLTILYDTGVLLRVLGCSGDLLRVASEELTRYLQDIGAQVMYFSGNEAEATNIIDTIIFVKDSGGELEGETAAALSDGEISISELRLLKTSFPERLAVRNIFPANRLESDAQQLARYQIDEKGFQEYLLSQANKSKRAYGVQNRINDASYLGNVMRLRRGVRGRDFVECRFIFVTPNTFLAAKARRFLIEQRLIAPQDCPPILSVGQVATIAWLIKDKKLAPEKAGRELLTSCFAAVRPDAEWFGFFREGIVKIVGSLEEYSADPKNSLALQSARRIAQEESFGSAALVRQLNLAEILNRAKAESDKLLRDQSNAIEAAKREAEVERQRADVALQEQRAQFAI